MKTYWLAGVALALLSAPVMAQDHSAHGGTPAPAPTPAEPQMDHSQMDHSQMDHGAMDHSAMGHGEPESDAPASADGSGTARLPGNEGGMHGWHLASGDWTLMAHGYVSAQYTEHSGPRGDDKLYSTTMGMLTAEHRPSWGRIQLKSMVSLEPAMDARGYPNLFATGETADGEPLVDRQHPHDLFMELAGRVDVDIAEGTSVFVYGGPVGEPALGPSAFMHRGSAANNPEPPIAHHWFDSTHITYGVVTAGVSSRRWQLEASAFRGREPDEDRWDIETPKLDSWSVRATFNPWPEWAIQASYGEIEEPEALHPGEDEHRFTASAHFASGEVSAMAAFSAKNRVPGDTLTAWLGEVNWDIDDRNALFGRIENVANDELFPDHSDPLHDRAFRVTKFQAGYARHIPLTGPLSLTLGASAAAYAKPDALDAAYGDNPWGYTVFARFNLGH